MRFLSFMCPWVPQDFFHTLLELWDKHTGEQSRLLVDLTRSGPSEEELALGGDPFSLGEAEAGLLCAPTYIWGRQRLELAGWTPVFEDTELPQYHSVVLTRAELGARSLEQLSEVRWCFNDPCSLSGYFSVLSSLPGAAANAVFSGGHMESLRMVAEGEADACAVDGNGWLIQSELREQYRPHLVEIDRLGPFLTQPLVLSSVLSESRKQRLRDGLSQLVVDSEALELLQRRFGLVRFVPVRESHFDQLKHYLGCTGAKRV